MLKSTSSLIYKKTALISLMCVLYILSSVSIPAALTLSELFNPQKLQADATEVFKKYTWEAAHHDEFDDDGSPLDLSYLMSSNSGIWEGFPSWITFGTNIPSSSADKERDIQIFIDSSRKFIVNELIMLIEISRYRNATNNQNAYSEIYNKEIESLNNIFGILIKNKLLNCSIKDFMNECSKAMLVIFKQIDQDRLEYMFKYINTGDGYHNSIFMITFPKYNLARVVYNGEHQTPPQTQWDWYGTCEILSSKDIVCKSQNDEKPSFMFKLSLDKHDLNLTDQADSFKKYLDETIGVMNIYIPGKFMWIYKK